MRAALIGLVALAGCATTDFAAEDHRICEAYGATGTMGYADCLEKRAGERAVQAASSQQRWAAFSQALSNANAAYQGQSQAQVVPHQRIGTTCHRRGEETSGMNKICYYDCLGSAAAITQSAVSLCPLTIKR